MSDANERVHPRAKGGSAHGAQLSIRRVRDLTLAAIRDGVFAPGDPLAEEHLMRMYSASRGAVRGALDQLSAIGVLERRPRTGTRVADVGIRMPLTDITLRTGGVISIRTIEERLVPITDFLRERLAVDSDSLRMVENLFEADGEPIGLRTAYFSTEIESDPRQLSGPITMPDLIRDFFDSVPGSVYVAVGAELADARTSRLLGIDSGAPLLRRQLTYLDEDGRPIELVFDAFLAERVTFDTGPVSID